MGIQDLLDNPNPDSPAHADAYALFKYIPFHASVLLSAILDGAYSRKDKTQYQKKILAQARERTA